MPRVTDEHRASRRDQILDAALRCFAERGFQATSMADIIAASGLSAGAIYLYFDSKREIAVGVARRAMGSSAADVLTRAASGRVPAPSQVLGAIVEALDSHGVPPGLAVQMWGEAAADPRFREIAMNAFTTLAAGFFDYLASWAVQTGRASPDQALAWAREVTPVLLAVSQGYLVQRALLPDFDSDRFLAGVAQVLG